MRGPNRLSELSADEKAAADRWIDEIEADLSSAGRDYEYNVTTPDPEFTERVAECVAERMSKNGYEVSRSDFPGYGRGLVVKYPAASAANSPAQTAEEDTNVKEEVRTLNERARRLLAFLHGWSLRAGGRPFSVSPHDPKTLKATGLNAEGYMQAAHRLIHKGLAEWMAMGGQLTITSYGITVAEDEEQLEYELPVGVKKSRETEVMMPVPDKRKVFVIHGRNIDARTAVDHFLKALKLEPLDFDELAADMGVEFVGNIVLEGLRRAQGIVVLFTPDEYSALLPSFRSSPSDTSPASLRWQGRPNVLFEAGIAFGMARERSVLVTLGSEVSLFSDAEGLHIVRLDNTVESRKKFRQKLIGTQCDVDQRTGDWTDPAKSGDFVAPLKGLSGVSPIDPFP